MKTPKTANITIQWIDEIGVEHIHTFNEKTLEDAETIIGLLTGNVREADLEE